MTMLNSENIQHNMGVLNSNFECSANDNAQVLDPLIPNLQIGWDPPDNKIWDKGSSSTSDQIMTKKLTTNPKL